MEFKIMSRESLEKLITNTFYENTAIISIVGHRSPNVDFSKLTANGVWVFILSLRFDDTVIDDKWTKGITDDDGIRIASFVDRIKDKCETLIVQCEAGVSRSAGVCAAIKKFITNDDMDIFTSPYYTPNIRCYRTVLNALMEQDMNDEQEKELKEKMELNEKMWNDSFDLIYEFDNYGNIIRRN